MNGNFIKEHSDNATPGVYTIACTVNKKIYVGGSIDILSRLKSHRSLLRKNKHKCVELQNEWNLYGEDFYNFSALEFCTERDVHKLEVKYIRGFAALDNIVLYNKVLYVMPSELERHIKRFGAINSRQ